MSMLAFTQASEFFAFQLLRAASTDRRVAPVSRGASELPIRVNLLDEEEAPCGALVPVEEDLERWDGLS